MRRVFLAVFWIVTAVLIAPPAMADWDVEDPHKMHHPQLPDPDGWDVFNTVNNQADPPFIKFLADDWRCSQTGAVNEIHIWGSWKRDDVGEVTQIHVQIHADAGGMPDPAPLWTASFVPGQFVERPYAQGAQGWYDPNTGEWEYPDHMGIWQYNIMDIQDPFVQIEGEIYWLVALFDVPDSDPPFSLYGWKTSRDHFGNPAMWSDDRVSWTPLMDPISQENLDLAFVINGDPVGDLLDFGDAPDAVGAALYPTLLASNGARHIIDPAVYLGAGVDPEPDGQPDGSATGDDLDIIYPPVNDDEDGVVFTTPLTPGFVTGVDVTASVNGLLDAWIDFNSDGDWDDPNEQIFTSTPLAAGLNSLNFAVPGGLGGGMATFSRFRFSRVGGLLPRDLAPDGEVEDHQVFIDEASLDFGDAPEGAAAPWYPTRLINNGPRHTIVPQFHLGTAIDPEPDGQPTPLADGDDLAGVPDDEDGVIFTSPIFQGGSATVDVIATAGGRLNAWLDFDGSHSWDPGEQIFVDVGLAPGINNLSFGVPASAVPGQTFARFRFSSLPGLTPVGYAPDGEVEDYEVVIEEELIDFGDAWFDPTGGDSYQTLLFSDGARHALVPRFFLGAAVDPEPDGQPTPPADGDDLAGVPDDEDGVQLALPIFPGDPAASVVVTATAIGGGLLDAWIDFDQSFTFDPGEQIFTSQVLANGINNLTYAVPAAAVPGPTYARFRFSANGGLNPWGFAPDGEVEDYLVDIIEPLDFGDAPDQYPVVLASNGARHLILPGFHMGAIVDPEPDGQPDIVAIGDDNDLYYPPPIDDEDGVFFTSPMVVGWQATMDVVASAGGGLLNAWIDFDQSGIWGDGANEQIFTDLPLVAGTNSLVIQLPLGIPTGITFARFRFSSAPGLFPEDFAPDGEVEDYLVRIEELIDFGDAPALTPPGLPRYPTLLSQNGAHHTWVPPIHFGALVDDELDGQPNADATGDDISVVDDEDGVFFPAAIVAGDPAAMVDIDPAGAPAFVNAWMDFNADDDWNDPGEHILVDVAIAAPGLQTFNFAVPPLATPGLTFARFRISSFPGLLPTGKALDGEVEDYRVRIDPSPFDFGDAPDTYPTLLANNGAFHQLDPDVYLGMLIDTEGDGIPDGSALGDDNFDLDDEDGVFPSPIVPGALSSFDVVASRDGLLNAWVDFDQDGDWQPGEQIFSDEMLNPGLNHLVYMVPAGVPLGPTFARFRFSTMGGLRPDGPVGTEPIPDGEVEDHLVRIAGVGELDFGDAPEIPYRTLLDSDGARHVAPTNLNLGFQIDNEGDGFPTADASGDDMNALDDEDGVSFTTMMLPGGAATVTVLASADGRLDGWIDFNADGDWVDPGERIFNGEPLPGGIWTPLGFNVPVDAAWGLTFARFRLSSAGGLDHMGLAADGEVEDEHAFIGDDYEVTGDFGDAPDSYQTLVMSSGPWHQYQPGVHLGATIDLEHDGKPDPAAAGDDGAFIDDEDGVAFLTGLVPGDPATIEVTASVGGDLDGWIDFDGDGMFLGASDRIFLAQPLVPGVNTLNFGVPFGAIPGPSYARFRFSRGVAPLPPHGWATNGEVEDYEVSILEMRLDFGDAPDPTYPTLLVSDGARHIVPLVPTYFMGESIDDDPDGQPTSLATGDDADGNDDEDGVRITPCLSPGSTAELQVEASLDGVVNAWVDFNGDGDWDDTGEHIVVGLNVLAGPNTIPFVVPLGPDIPDTFARVRFTPDQLMGGELPTGLATDGEVEDHWVRGTGIFCDDFESGDTTAWTITVP